MAEVICDEDCGNAPKKALLRELNAELANGRTEAFRSNVTDNIVWNVVGEKRLEGMDEFSAYMTTLQKEEVVTLRIDNIITHGWIAAVNGVVTTRGGATHAFCDVYRFSGASKNAKIKEITSYRISLK